MTDKTGGPAFPVFCDQTDQQLYGMTLRDYFAAKAMQSIISRMDRAQYNYIGAEAVTLDAYAFADAMLKERSK